MVRGTCLRRTLNVYRECRSWFDPKKTVCGDCSVRCCYLFYFIMAIFSRKPENLLYIHPGCFVYRFNSARVKNTAAHCLSETTGTFRHFSIFEIMLVFREGSVIMVIAFFSR